ncbi:MAG: (2Fe-2S)-binding protein [Planctomycetales bacterium]|nr:(2Fe-2S)-binding protein [Planctomycetales bacterium]
MVRIYIDQTPVDVPEGTTVLDAARCLGIDVPSLCKHPDHPPNTSCMCCLVKIDDSPRATPSCASVVTEGMRVESETAELHALRRTGIELLLADHAGDCHAPCENTCPAHMDIPNMLRHAAEGDFRTALETVKRDIALPAILGRVCPEVCEGACRRGRHDSPAAICKIKQYVADVDLGTETPYVPVLAPASGKSVAIVGGGISGTTAAFHLAQRGHRCEIFEAEPELGGRLRTEFDIEALPDDVRRRELAGVLRMGVAARYEQPVAAAERLEELALAFDCVLLATGRQELPWLAAAGIQATSKGVDVNSSTRMTSRSGVFAAGNAVRRYALAVQSVAEGKLVAQCIDCWLREVPVPDRRRTFESRLARLSAAEACDFCEGASPASRMTPAQFAVGPTPDQVQAEAERCLACDCQSLGSCALHHYAQLYDCDADRYRGKRGFEGRLEGERVTLEWGKCIVCGICVQIAGATPDAGGLAILHRSRRIRIEPAQGSNLDDALGSGAEAAVVACPTGALAWKRGAASCSGSR